MADLVPLADINDNVVRIVNGETSLSVTVIKRDNNIRVIEVAVTLTQGGIRHKYFTIRTSHTPRELLDMIGIHGYTRTFGESGVNQATATYQKKQP